MRQYLILIAIALLFLGLIAQRMWSYATAVTERYEHFPGSHAGNLVSLGDDRYHVEVVFTKDGLLKLYTLDQGGSRVVEVEARPLTAHVTPEGENEAHVVELRPEPQVGDMAGRTSCFGGKLPTALERRSVRLSVPNLSISGERFHLTYVGATADHPDMPAPAAAAEERMLHLVAGGKYTEADIEANGRMVPSQKYRGFQARHDFAPKPGDQLCPVTRTKADPTCNWTVGGKVHLFCCPPCIDEFVRLAKAETKSVQPVTDTGMQSSTPIAAPSVTK